MSEVAGYIIVVVSASLGGWGEMWTYSFACPPKLRGRHTISVVAHSVGYRGRGENGKLVQIARKCDA